MAYHWVLQIKLGIFGDGGYRATGKRDPQEDIPGYTNFDVTEAGFVLKSKDGEQRRIWLDLQCAGQCFQSRMTAGAVCYVKK